MASFWQRLFHKQAAAEPEVAAQPATTAQTATPATPQWEDVPLYVEVDPKQNVVPALIAASVTATQATDSQLVLKHLYVQNPEAQLVSVIASSCATTVGDGKFVVKSIRKRVDQ